MVLAVRAGCRTLPVKRWLGLALLPVGLRRLQLAVEIFAPNSGEIEFDVGAFRRVGNKGGQGAAAGGLVTGIFVCRCQIVAGAHPVDEPHKVFAAVQAVLLNPSRFGKAAGTIGYLKALFAVFDALIGAGGGQAAVFTGKNNVMAAIIVAAGGGGGFGGAVHRHAVALKTEEDFTALAVFENRPVALPLEAAVNLTEVAVGANGVDVETVASNFQVLLLIRVFDLVCLRGAGQRRGGGQSNGQAIYGFQHGAHFLLLVLNP
ncbi:hypothetical protein HMPREF9371_1094 [Neisseria shayeganii 871]|uniref:Uncharacterized protein n=1 Tax=Neisseria shayeganii 871 TaxID=1032488 RepID=G4CHK5_9NEIS|nr:hypothetical protein HMPREF9371_1094 [Neisseria shayeganii 871]